jgi:type II secretory pathway pseudopilin PulG
MVPQRAHAGRGGVAAAQGEVAVREQRTHAVGRGGCVDTRRWQVEHACARTGAAFSLIEVLVVCAVVSVFLGLLLPAVERVRAVAGRCLCQANLRQISMAWDLYQGDSGGRFYQGVNHNYDFGGWQGDGPCAANRPLNRYLGLPAEMASQDTAKVFRCPSDRGGPDYPGRAFSYFGNSYQTNLMLVGPKQLPAANWVPEPCRTIHAQVNPYLPELKHAQLKSPSHLVLVGDHNWVLQWEPMNVGLCGGGWHGPAHSHNLAFVDGHAAQRTIYKGIYVHDSYRIVPVGGPLAQIRHIQQPLPCVCGIP